MMSRRRYRLLTLAAVVALFLLYRLSSDSWAQQQQQQQQRGGSGARPPLHRQAAPLGPDREHVKPPVGHKPQEPLRGPPRPAVAVPDRGAADDAGRGGGRLEGGGRPAGAGDAERTTTTTVDETGDAFDKKKGAADEGSRSGTSKNKMNGAADNIDEADDDDDETDENAPSITWKNPPKDQPLEMPKPDDAKDHWIRPQEHYPIPVESMIPLPAGPAKKLPKIQADFEPESGEAIATRQHRFNMVKRTLERSWAAYKKHAWMHDELSPVSGHHRDPFCAWSATLVDALDTLWIAGLKSDFHDAAHAVKNIDFTYTPRADIPVFETVIRYLGGLLGAYDVSGGPRGDYPFLLDKAVELAEVLMGIFDTPNRMPLLYYQWRPQYASQPHRAGRVGVAELATLSMEFTRLAQLTGQPKYYDAVDRITDALVDLQRRGTGLPGLFPESLDASGCNRTATDLRDAMSAAAREQVDSQEVLAEPDGFVVDRIAGLDSVLDENRRKEETASSSSPPPGPPNHQHARRGADGSFASSSSSSSADVGSADAAPGAATKTKEGRAGPYGANGKLVDWDCVPQGLVPASSTTEKYHMGGGQDSAYEYFPKQFLLLGGREPKYQKLYEDAADAVAERLLFRPMTPVNRDVLFPAKLSTSGSSPDDFRREYEVAHLTCFIGGMFGLGGRLFSRDADIELAKKLTDGCVWAYESTASGIMPEAANVLPCASKESCEFDEALWWAALDPSKDWREQRVRAWDTQQAKAKTAPAPRRDESPPSGGIQRRAVLPDTRGRSGDKKKPVDDFEGSALPASLRNKLGGRFGGADGKAESDADGPKKASSADKSARVRQQDEEHPVAPEKKKPVSDRPQTHEEYVKHIIERNGLPPGWVSVARPEYILRPEAIESVWYMHRISGNVAWQNKGWKMFEDVSRATRTSMANSAVDNVMKKEPTPKDEMESFWIGETLKYFLLLFSTPDVISLDEWVLNTEAHPFKL
ncbi:hypothetical protein CDD83_4810 [Cordyceps sp. RAO-2017]|nr:hypothetical protein CDD83_4810 [Cordyceps sp. RAO-2017]